jgi:[acyl-carrier-protein] S-malonyltransferase
MKAALYPGQGAQLVGMGKDVAERFSVASETYQQADEILGYSISSLCFDGPAEELNRTDIQQPAIFVTSVAIYRAAVDAGVISADQFDAMGGLSLGEYTALHLADAIPFGDALRLVHERGKLMQQASEAADGAMVSIIGLDDTKVLALCERVAGEGRIGPANFNCPGQIVISGDARACHAAVAAIDAFGGKAVPLKVAGAFHSELMRPAAEGLKGVLADAEISPPRIRVVANVDAAYHGEPDSIRESLYRQVFGPVRWQACVERLVTDGCEAAWEIGPNRVLTGLMRKINRGVRMTNLSKAADLEVTG